MSPQVPTTEGVRPQWVRAVALALNKIIGGYPYPFYEADPPISGLKEGFTYWNTTTHKPRSFDGTVFVDHF
jgi:hypothetical protein